MILQFAYIFSRDFKLLRLVTACETIRRWRESERGRSTPASIGLMVGLVYMINALSSRPIELTAEKEIRASLLKGVLKSAVAVNVDGDEEELEPQNPLRILFPTSVILNSEIVPVPQLGPDYLMPESIYARLFDGRNMLAMQLAADQPEIVVSRLIAEEVGNRVRHRRSRVLKHKGPSTADENIAIPQEMQVLQANPMANPIQTTADDLSQMVTALVARSYMDMLECSPNIKSSSSMAYCRLTEKERRAATPATFQEPNLALIWNKCIVKPGDMKTWDMSFSYLYAFHYREEPPKSKWQNFKQCPFFVTWNTLMQSVSIDSGKDLQALVRVSLHVYFQETVSLSYLRRNGTRFYGYHTFVVIEFGSQVQRRMLTFREGRNALRTQTATKDQRQYFYSIPVGLDKKHILMFRPSKPWKKQ
jgi:hypothetical protein